MSKNYRLVEYFVSEFYRNRPEELEHIISPTFKFTNSEDGVKNFAQYVEVIKAALKVSTITIDKIRSIDDVTFFVDISVEMMESATIFGQEIRRKAKITVKNNLIESSEVLLGRNGAEIIKFNQVS